MALRTNNKLRLGGVYFGKSKDPKTLVDYHLQHGLAAAYDPGVEDRVQMGEIVAAFKENDIVIAETGAFSINILETDPALLEKNIAQICRRLERAEWVGSLCCVGHGGTVSSGAFGVHNPENFSQKSFDTIVSVVQRIMDSVKPEKTRFCLETESRYMPDSPEIYRDLIEAVARPGFAAHLDPINITSNPRRFYFSGDFIRDCFAKLGPYIVSCHAKDTQMVRNAQVRFEETFAGNGGLDFQTYISELAKTPNDAPLMHEHFPERQQNWAFDFLYEQAAEVGVPIRNAEFRLRT
jgi:sugar phosphate isomerase/epimerase